MKGVFLLLSQTRTEPTREGFKNLCEGIQSIALTLAILIGGLWTLYIFNAQLQVENARAQLQKTNREIEPKTALQLDMSIAQLEVPADTGRYLSVMVKVQNNGSRDTVLKIDQAPLKVSRMLPLSESGKWAYEPPIVAYKLTITNAQTIAVVSSQTNFVHETDEIPFIVKVDRPGLYLVNFAIPSNVQEANQFSSAHLPSAPMASGSSGGGGFPNPNSLAKKNLAAPVTGFEWQVSRYFVVY
jgi:hypothetical protein